MRHPATNLIAEHHARAVIQAHGKPFNHPHLFLSHRTIEKQTILDHNNLFGNPYLEGDPDEIILEENLPLTRFKLPPEEEENGSIRTSKCVRTQTHPILNSRFEPD